MASELRGPTVARQLEPPGFLALNYGARTPISMLIAHLAFGAMLGGFYSPADSGRPARAVPAPRRCASPQPGVHSPRACSGSGPRAVDASVTSKTMPHAPARAQISARFVVERERRARGGARPQPHRRAGVQPHVEDGRPSSCPSRRRSERRRGCAGKPDRDRSVSPLSNHDAAPVHVTLNRCRTCARHQARSGDGRAWRPAPAAPRSAPAPHPRPSGGATLARSPRISAAAARTPLTMSQRTIVTDRGEAVSKRALPRSAPIATRDAPRRRRAPAPAPSRGVPRKGGTVPGRNSVKPARASARQRDGRRGAATSSSDTSSCP